MAKDTSGAGTGLQRHGHRDQHRAVAGKETVQVYLQKPYGDYNKQNDVEAASAELVAFDKTDLLQPGQSQTLTIPVNERQFASYDAYNAGTYVLTEGDYYLTAAKNAHDAVNNFLAKKGYTIENTQNRMDADAMPPWSATPIACALDTETYSTSVATGAAIEKPVQLCRF